MYDRYFGYYKQRIPFVKLERCCIEGYSTDSLILKNTAYGSDFRNYSDPLKGYMERRRKVLETVNRDADVKFMKVILVSGDINRIRKSALILADGIDVMSYDDDDEDYEYAFNYDEEENDEASYSSDIFEIELGKDMADERVAGNPYAIKTAKIAVAATQNFKANGVLFRGLEAGSLEDQCAAIASVTFQNVFVGIPSEMEDMPEIRRLMLERGFDIIRLPDVEPSYYRNVADKLIEFGGVPFETDELKETVIGGVIKKCGKYISEENISAVLTYGLLRMKEGEDVFRSEHFKDYINISSGSALETLNAMTGLHNLKSAVREYTAIRKEMKRNPLSGLECTHLIFEGNPGGGKTVSSRLLSDILAAEGITNGTFVSASRSDIIGEYLGHTAPKVAKLFRDAAGGVLFVDEAGFFTQKTNSSYVDEAIKEFVRYMETCRDVTVIFAMYPGEAEKFLELDEGLASRISAVIKFEDYTEKELSGIFKYMLTAKGYKPAKGVCAQAGKCLMELKSRSGERFGNAREARKLVDYVIKAVALRHDRDNTFDDVVSASDLKAAFKAMGTSTHTVKKTAAIGFMAHKSTHDSSLPEIPAAARAAKTVS